MNQWKQKDITAIRFWNSLIAHRVVVLTEKTKKDYIKKFHVPTSKICCIYNWIEKDVLELKQPYNLESRKILSVGRFGKEKGYDMLVEVAKKILRNIHSGNGMFMEPEKLLKRQQRKCMNMD